MDLYEALYTTRAMRRVTSDPIPDDVVSLMLDAAIRAPSAGNTQNWRFLTVTARDSMEQLATLYQEAWDQLNATVYASNRERAEEAGDDQTLRVLGSADWLAANFARLPLVVLALHRNDPTGASIYPAVWNLMLAARGRGVGATLTTVLGHFKHREVLDLFDIPQDKGWKLAAAVTCGYPTGKWGVAARPPVQQVVFSEKWGQAPPWTVDEARWPSGT